MGKTYKHRPKRASGRRWPFTTKYYWATERSWRYFSWAPPRWFRLMKNKKLRLRQKQELRYWGEVRTRRVKNARYEWW